MVSVGVGIVVLVMVVEVVAVVDSVVVICGFSLRLTIFL